MGNPANLLRALVFAVLGAIVGYFILTRITPLIGFSQGLGGMENVGAINTVLGIVVFGLVGLNLKKWLPLLIGGLIGAFIGAFLSIILAAFFTDFIWYSIFEEPVFTDKIYDPVRSVFWIIFVLIGVKMAVKINKGRHSSK